MDLVFADDVRDGYEVTVGDLWPALLLAIQTRRGFKVVRDAQAGALDNDGRPLAHAPVRAYWFNSGGQPWA